MILNFLKNKFEKGYEGDVCQRIVCSRSDPVECASYNKQFCNNKFILSYCPGLCGVRNSECNSDSTPDNLSSEASTKVFDEYTTSCSPKTCLNMGVFNKTTCECNCLPSKLSIFIR